MSATDACPMCGFATPAAFKRSDNVMCLRCDRCGHVWAAPQPKEPDDLPPLASIDAPGG